MIAQQKDLIILVADKNIEFTIKGLLTRHQSLNIRPITYDIRVHPERDPGCFRRGHDFLRPFIQRYSRALILFDRDGCGKTPLPRTDLERETEDRLFRSGWSDRAAVIVLDPEIEIWVWSTSPHVDTVLGWAGKQPDLRTWLREQGLLASDQEKPEHPKEAVEEALKEADKAHSSALYKQLAEKVSFSRCTDPAFIKFSTLLKEWFPNAEL